MSVYYGSLKFSTFSPETVSGSYPGAAEIGTLHAVTSYFILTLSAHLRLRFPSGLFLVGFPIKTFCALLIRTCATCPAHPILRVKVFFPWTAVCSRVMLPWRLVGTAKEACCLQLLHSECGSSMFTETVTSTCQGTGIRVAENCSLNSRKVQNLKINFLF